MNESVETLLRAMFRGQWPAEVDPYRLNTLLKLKPWWPPLVTVWRRRELGPEPDTAGTALHQAWPEAQALLDELHQKYIEAHDHD